MNIFAWWRARRADKQAAQALYNALLVQARQRVFYDAAAVPDTADGRFDMIALHGFIVMRAAPGMTRRLRQYLFDAMFRDFDRACREMGLGDLSVPRHVKGMMKAFKGRYYAYDAALDDAVLLAQALRRNIYRKAEHIDDEVINALAAYVRASCATVAATAQDELRAGRIVFAAMEVTHGQHKQAA